MPTVEYLNKSRYNNLMVIATEATINSHIFKNNGNKRSVHIYFSKVNDMLLDNVRRILHDNITDIKLKN